MMNIAKSSAPATLDESLVLIQAPVDELARKNRHFKEVPTGTPDERELHYRPGSCVTPGFGLHADLRAPDGAGWTQILLPHEVLSDRNLMTKTLSLVISILDVSPTRLRSATDGEGNALIDLSRVTRRSPIPQDKGSSGPGMLQEIRQLRKIQRMIRRNRASRSTA